MLKYIHIYSHWHISFALLTCSPIWFLSSDTDTDEMLSSLSIPSVDSPLLCRFFFYFCMQISWQCRILLFTVKKKPILNLLFVQLISMDPPQVEASQ